MRASTSRVLWFGRLGLAFAIGAALPHAIDALLAGPLGAVALPALDAMSAVGRGRVRLALGWTLVGLPTALLLARLAGAHAWACALAAAGGGLAAIAAPFVVYSLPIGAGTPIRLWPHLLASGVLWPAAIVVLARRP